MFKRLRNHQR